MSRSLLSRNRFFRIFLGGWLILSAVQVLIVHTYGFSWMISTADSLCFNGIVGICCLCIMYIMQFYLPGKRSFEYIIAISVLGASVTAGAGSLLAAFLFRGDNIYITFLRTAWPVRAAVAFLLSASLSMLGLVFYTMEEQKQSELRKRDAEKLSREAELYNLRRQLQPHFLFNSLNSISALTGSRPEEARRMIQQLSDFLRGTIRKDENQFIPFGEELAHLQLYLDIEKVRFGHRLQVDMQCDDSVMQAKTPVLILQPIVENAIKFGLYDTIGEVCISISAILENNMLVLRVGNPFDPASAARGGAGFGLSAVRRRLYLLFARNDLLATSEDAGYFITVLKIPQ